MKKNNSYPYQKIRGLKRKMKLIELKGGCCKKCGYNKNISAFDFHHKEPSQKDFKLDMRKLSNSSMIKLMEEFEKCELLCANCHRELHFPELEMSKAKLLIKNVDESVLKIKKIGKPKCLDCGCQINYTYKRCVKCNAKHRRKVERPNLETLISEIETYSQKWCAEKYGVSRTTIMRWVKK